MKSFGPWITVLCLLFSIPASAQKDQLPSDSDLTAISARGRLLYEYDEAAWHASDAVMAMNPAKELLGNYIAHKTDGRWVVAFGHLNETHDAFLIAVVATQSASPQVFTGKRLDPPLSDTGFLLAGAKAIGLAEHHFEGANRPYNAAVLPAQDGQLYVYVVPSGTDADPYPLGADTRFLISADGGTIVENRRLHKGLIPNGGPVPAGATIAAGTHSHVLSDLPEDTDVFHVLTRRPSIPEYIATETAIYAVNTDGTIKIVQRIKKHR